MKSYKQKNYEQALIETYLKFDELLRLEKVNQFLKNNMMSKKNSRLDITFSSTLQSDSSSSLIWVVAALNCVAVSGALMFQRLYII